MKKIGIRELRSNLKRVLEDVDRGVPITITDRGRPRAVIQPVEPRVETAVERGIREGWATVGPEYYEPRTDTRPLRTSKARPGAPTVDEIFAEDRAERF